MENKKEADPSGGTVLQKLIKDVESAFRDIAKYINEHPTTQGVKIPTEIDLSKVSIDIEGVKNKVRDVAKYVKEHPTTGGVQVLCKHCLSALDPDKKVCTVCKIPSGKKAGEFSEEERQVQYYCRALYVIGWLSVFAGIAGLLAIFVWVYYFFMGKIPDNDFSLEMSVRVLAGTILFSSLWCLGVSLWSYKKWCYWGGILIACVVMADGFLGRNTLMIIEIVLGALLFSCIASPTSKKILYRLL